MKRFALLLLILLLLGAAGFALFKTGVFSPERAPLVITLAAPVSGDQADEGAAMRRGVELLIEELNQKGGIAGRQLKLEIHDDANDPEKAVSNAEAIASGTSLAVIGHLTDDATSMAGEQYAELGIVSVSPIARGEYTVTANEWLFRMSNNVRRQAEFTLNYIHQIIEQQQITVLSESHPYGANLSEQLLNQAADHELDIMFDAEVDGDSGYLDLEIGDLLDSMPYPEEAGVIFIAARAKVGALMVKVLRDAGYTNILIGPDSFTSPEFMASFRDYPAEQIYPGYYSNQVVAVSDLIYDSANKAARDFRDRYKARYEQTPSITAAFSYDTMKLLAFALERSGIAANDKLSVDEARSQLRDFLAAMNSPDFAMYGITGHTWFDEEGDVLKDQTVGVFKSQRLISLFTQLRNIRYLNEILNLEQEMEQGNVLPLGNRFLYRTSIVKTGVQLNGISDINSAELTTTLDFDIWFRYQGELDLTRIVFDNAKEPIELGEPVEQETSGPTRYVRYNVTGTFRLDFLDFGFGFNRHVASLTFHHRDLTLNNLLYVPDVVGMSLDKGLTLRDQMLARRVIAPEEDWQLGKVSFFADITKEYPLGRPEYLSLVSGVLEHSSFNMAMILEREGLNPRGSLEIEIAEVLFFVTTPLLILLWYLWLSRTASALLLGLYSIAIVIFIWVLEMVIIGHLAEYLDPAVIPLILLGFDVWWWLMPAYILTEFIKRFLWLPLENKAGHPIPGSIKLMVSSVIYVTAGFGVIAFVFDQKLTSLLATSGMLAMIIGLALQMNLNNIFAGIALNIERPFRIGDWIEIDDKIHGVVTDITWRTTRIKERSQNILSIPNFMASESVVRNFNYPNNIYRTTVYIHVEPGHDQRRTMELITEAMNEVERVVEKPPAFVRYKGSTGWSDEYMLAYHADNFQKKFDTDSQVMLSLWDKLGEHDMAPAVESKILRLVRTIGQHSSRNLAGKENRAMLDQTILEGEIADTRPTESSDPVPPGTAT